MGSDGEGFGAEKEEIKTLAKTRLIGKVKGGIIVYKRGKTSINDPLVINMEAPLLARKSRKQNCSISA